MPSSKRRIAASRANGKKSRGPVTPEGKARSAANSLVRHGLSSTNTIPTAICLSNEDHQEFVLLHQALVTEHTPVTTTEHLTVYEMAVIRWRLHRAWLMESALVDNQMDHMVAEIDDTYEAVDETTRTALAFRALTEQSPTLSVLNRYDARLTRQFDKCLARLDNLRAQRQIQAPEQEFPAEPKPTNGHSNHDHHPCHDEPLPAAGSDPASRPAQPPPCEATRQREPGEPAAPATPDVADLCHQVRGHVIEPRPGDPPPLPRAA